MIMSETFTLAYIIWNAFVFLLYAWDKLCARHGMRRISEKMLLSCAVFMGAVGACLGMELCRHKTKHTKFIIIVRLFVVINLFIFFFVLKK